MSKKYIQLHPTDPATGVIDESLDLYPKIGPGSFEDFAKEGKLFEPQEKLKDSGEGQNLKTITAGTSVFSLLGNGTITLPLLNLLYPIGSVYISTTDEYEGECPIHNTLGGTWERIKDVFLYAGGNNDTLGATGGSKDAVVVSHSHSTSNNGEHTHTVSTVTKSGTIDIASFDTGGEIVRNATGSITINVNEGNSGSGMRAVGSMVGIDRVPEKITISTEHRHTLGSDGGHTHTTDTVGESGTGKNMPPYQVVFAWKRTA